jgi:hypothetical protein
MSRPLPSEETGGLHLADHAMGRVEANCVAGIWRECVDVNGAELVDTARGR